jgi:hypothetical protein
MTNETPKEQQLASPSVPTQKSGLGFNVLSVIAAVLAALAWSAVAGVWGALFLGYFFALPFALVGIPTYFAPLVALFLLAAATAFLVWKFLGKKFVWFTRVFAILIFLPVISLGATVFGSFGMLHTMNVSDTKELQEKGKFMFDTRAAKKDPDKVLTLEVEEIPTDIARYKNLKTLVVNGGSNYKYPTTLPDSLAELPQLEALIVYSANKFETFPPVVTRLTKLRILRIDTAFSNSTPRQKPLVLPEDIGNLENLEELSLEHNQIQELPKSIGKLKKLRKLQLTDNNLTTLPAEFGDLTNLEELKIEANILTGWPSSMSKLTSLRLVFISKRLSVEVENELVKMLPSYTTVRSY